MSPFHTRRSNQRAARHLCSLLAVLLIVLPVSACLPPTPSPTPVPPTATVTITPTPTVTIVWFPPTPTFTPAPTRIVEPTVDLRPHLGAVWLKDDFTGQDQWQTTRNDIGSVAYGKQELTLAVSAERGALLSLRKTPQFNNFYMEVDALPSLCRAGDIYGVLLRAASGGDYYRLMMNCNGELRMERVMNSRYTVLKDWVSTGQVRPGGMLRARLGVLAQDADLSVFVNDAFQFSVRDTAFESGALGVYARAAGDSPLTVNFSNLVVYYLDQDNGRDPSAVTPTPEEEQ